MTTSRLAFHCNREINRGEIYFASFARIRIARVIKAGAAWRDRKIGQIAGAGSLPAEFTAFSPRREPLTSERTHQRMWAGGMK